jgi:hypothetical protein
LIRIDSLSRYSAITDKFQAFLVYSVSMLDSTRIGSLTCVALFAGVAQG